MTRTDTLSQKQLLTHSRLSCMRSCPRRHYLAYELGLRPAEDGFALRVGSAFHAALEAADHGEDPDALLAETMDDPFEQALVVTMYHGHAARWAEQPLEVWASELEFRLPLTNPATGAATPLWDLGGKIDRIIRLADGRLAIHEYKTTSRDFSPGAEYWVQLYHDQQLSIYVNAARACGYDVQTVLYDVTRRPMMRPLKATPEDQRKFTKAGTLYANQRDVDETPEEYGARIAADIALRPDHYFARIEIARLDQDLEECLAELWQQQLAIRAAQRLGHWWRNPAACLNPYPCSYLGICLHRDLDTQTPDGFVRLGADVHPELSDISVGE